MLPVNFTQLFTVIFVISVYLNHFHRSFSFFVVSVICNLPYLSCFLPLHCNCYQCIFLYLSLHILYIHFIFISTHLPPRLANIRELKQRRRRRLGKRRLKHELLFILQISRIPGCTAKILKAQLKWRTV